MALTRSNELIILEVFRGSSKQRKKQQQQKCLSKWKLYMLLSQTVCVHINVNHCSISSAFFVGQKCCILHSVLSFIKLVLGFVLTWGEVLDQPMKKIQSYLSALEALDLWSIYIPLPRGFKSILITWGTLLWNYFETLVILGPNHVHPIHPDSCLSSPCASSF